MIFMIYCFSKHKETFNMLISYVCQKSLYLSYEYVLIPGMSTHQEKSYTIFVVPLVTAYECIFLVLHFCYML
jgi:hypothetical protein